MISLTNVFNYFWIEVQKRHLHALWTTWDKNRIWVLHQIVTVNNKDTRLLIAENINHTETCVHARL